MVVKTSSLATLALIILCTSCSVESIQCINGKAYRFRSGEIDLCPRFSIENDKLICYDNAGNIVALPPKSPMKMAEYSKFKRRVDSDPLAGFVSSECISSAISE